MPHTLYLRGQLLGETDFEIVGPGPSQRLGVFRPTQAGRDMLPRITGLIAAAFAMKDAMERDGTKADDADADQIMHVLEETPEGQRVCEMAAVLAALELHDPAGQRLTVKSIAVSDVRELQRLALERCGRPALSDATVDVASAESHTDAVGQAGEPQYLISASFTSERKTSPRWLGRPPGLNWRN